MRHNIFCTIGAFAPEASKALGHLGRMRCATVDNRALIKHMKDVTILVTGVDHRIGTEVMDAAPRLQIIATPATGTDHIDSKAAKQRNIVVLSLKGETDFLRTITGTAELALGLMIDLLRGTHSAAEAVRSGTWNRDAWMGQTLSGKNLGIVGLGRLGSLLAGYASSLGMHVIYTDPMVSQKKYEAVPFEELLRRSDIISLHIPLTPKTIEMIDAQAMRQMQPGTLLINTSRGGIVKEKDILASLKKEHLGGYATDVLAHELSFSGKKAKDPLISYAKTHGNVIITPHIGGMTMEGRNATDTFIAKKICATVASL
jgi:D-3-phosphoglycerate dehydrogenase